MSAAVQGPDYRSLVSLSQEEALKAVLDGYVCGGLQATQLGRARGLLRRMLDRRAAGEERIFVSYTSNLISCGLRETLVYLAKEGLVDGFISTAGGVEEDVIKCLGPTLLGQFGLPGVELRKKGLNRIGNLLVPNDNYCRFEDFFMPLLRCVHEEQRACRWGDHIAPSQIIAKMGEELAARYPGVCEESLVCCCYRRGIPIFCPAFTDGSMGDMVYFYNFSKKGLVIDPLRDVQRLQRLGSVSGALPVSRVGCLSLGGGLPRHHLWSNVTVDDAVVVTTGTEAEGCSSAAMRRDDQSAGLVQPSTTMVKVQGDATVILPLLLS